MSLVGIAMGSKSDAETMQPALDVLDQLGIEYEVSVISAHRTPEKARQYAEEHGITYIQDRCALRDTKYLVLRQNY